jgi:hypothetical protein
MPHQKVRAFGDIHRVALKCDEVQISKSGGFYKARWRGSANFVFGNSPKHAEERLRKAPTAPFHNNQQNTDTRQIRNRQDRVWNLTSSN